MLLGKSIFKDKVEHGEKKKKINKDTKLPKVVIQYLYFGRTYGKFQKPVFLLTKY